jgi:hypothetical protein
MKRLFYFYLILSIVYNGCNHPPAIPSIDYSQMDHILLSSLEFPGGFSEPIILYDQFYNKGTSYENQVAYHSFEEPMNYSISKRTTEYLSSRNDKPLPEDLVKSLKKYLNVTLTNDSIVMNQSLLLISEPFSMSDNIFSFTITRKTIGRNPPHEYWIYYIEKKTNRNKKYKILTVYDWQKDMLYKVEKLSAAMHLVIDMPL